MQTNKFRQVQSPGEKGGTFVHRAKKYIRLVRAFFFTARAKYPPSLVFFFFFCVFDIMSLSLSLLSSFCPSPSVSWVAIFIYRTSSGIFTLGQWTWIKAVENSVGYICVYFSFVTLCWDSCQWIRESDEKSPVEVKSNESFKMEIFDFASFCLFVLSLFINCRKIVSDKVISNNWGVYVCVFVEWNFTFFFFYYKKSYKSNSKMYFICKKNKIISFWNFIQ